MRRVDEMGTTYIDGRSSRRDAVHAEEASSPSRGLDVTKPTPVIASLVAATVCALITMTSSPVVSLAISLCMIWSVVFAPWVKSAKSEEKASVGGVVIAFVISAAIVAFSAKHADAQGTMALVFLAVGALAVYRHVERFATH